MTGKSREDVIVIGAGQMGAGIAQAFVGAGYAVLLIDTSQDQLDKAREGISDGLERVRAKAPGLTIGKLRTAVDWPGASDATLLVESAVERLDVKQEIVRRAERILAPTALIATNTSALSVTEIATVLADPGRCLGMHFFNPVHRMRLVELVRGIMTRPATLEAARGFVEKLGKTAVVVRDNPGLATSRVSALLGNEAMMMLMEGVASAEDIDTALRLGLNHPMGPLELGDLTGWDTRLKVLEHLADTLGDRFRPCPLIRTMVASGRVGRKAGAGVYRYEGGERVGGSACF